MEHLTSVEGASRKRKDRDGKEAKTDMEFNDKRPCLETAFDVGTEIIAVPRPVDDIDARAALSKPYKNQSRAERAKVRQRLSRKCRRTRDPYEQRELDKSTTGNEIFAQLAPRAAGLEAGVDVRAPGEDQIEDASLSQSRGRTMHDKMDICKGSTPFRKPCVGVSTQHQGTTLEPAGKDTGEQQAPKSTTDNEQETGDQSITGVKDIFAIPLRPRAL